MRDYNACAHNGNERVSLLLHSAERQSEFRKMGILQYNSGRIRRTHTRTQKTGGKCLNGLQCLKCKLNINICASARTRIIQLQPARARNSNICRALRSAFNHHRTISSPCVSTSSTSCRRRLRRRRCRRRRLAESYTLREQIL